MRLSLALEKTRGAIFQIKHKSDVALGAGIGTAFAVSDDGLLVTAKHVVDGYGDGDLVLAYGLPPVNYKGVLKLNGMFVGIPKAKVVAIDDANDIAIIKTPQPLSEYKFQFDDRLPEVTPRSLQLDLTTPTEGESIAVSGYPLNEPSLVTTSGYLASSWTLVDYEGDKYERFLGDITVNGGNSGGPVYKLQNAKVIGVAVAYKTAPSTDIATGNIGQLAHNSGLTIIVPAQAVQDLINTL